MKINLICLWIATIATVTAHINFLSNFNKQKIKESYNDEPLSIPVIIKSNLERKYNQAISSKFDIKKFELRDSDFVIDPQTSTPEDQLVFHNDLTPLQFFQPDRIAFNDYQVLQIRDFKVIMTNPTSQFKMCVTNIVSDSDTITRIEHRQFPICILASTRYPLYFRFHMTEFKIKNIFKTTIYFFVDLYNKKDGNFSGNKIWPYEVLVKIHQNFLHLGPLEARNCGKNYTTINIANHEPHHIKLNFDSDQDVQQKGAMRQVMIPSQKTFKMTLMPKQKIITISARAFQLTDIKYPKLFMPIYCYDLLSIDSYEIGILNSERSIYEFPLLVSTYSREKIQILTIQLISSNENVQILPVEGLKSIIQPGRMHRLVGKMILHPNQIAGKKSSIIVRVLFVITTNPKQILQTHHQFKYYEYKNPMTFGGKRFINVRQKKAEQSTNENKKGLLDNLFTIKNNLDIPLQLVNVISDSEIFKVTWVKQLKQYIYPTHQKDLIMVEYLGPKNLTISPIRFTVTLQFNGKIYVPVQFIIFDESLQCVFNNIQQKCQNLPPIDYGYFRNNSTKFKQLVIRNWNPTSAQLQVDLLDNIIQKYGMNFTITIFGPFPSYDMPSHRINNTLYYFLKGGHFIIINFALTPLKNAITGSAPFEIRTSTQTIRSQVKFSFENATIALIPQVLRLKSAYQRSVQYLNLVSTYSQPYKIKSTNANMSNLHVYAKNDTFIYENQWVGLALVFQPFLVNITDSCCGNQFAVNSFINTLYLSEPRKPIYSFIRIQTSTDLEVNSTVIIDNHAPKMISQENITLRLLKMKNSFPSLIPIKNIFTQPVKFSVVLTPEYLYRDARHYMLTMRRVRKLSEQAMFCVNNGITVKHNFSPQMVKTLFNLEGSPQEVTIEPLENSEYYIDSERKSFQGSSKYLSDYVIETVNQGARICYKITTSRYIKELIQTKILNDLAENHSNEIFLQFVEKQMEYFNIPFHFLQNDQFYDSLSIDFKEYCSKTTFPLFRFCKQINLLLTPKQEVVLFPNQQINITLQKGNFQSGEADYSFYLTLLNNITKYESHFTSVHIKEPKLALSALYINNKTAIQKQVLDKSSFSDIQWIRLIGKTNFNYQKDILSLNRFKSSTLPIVLNEEQCENSTYSGLRTFTIENRGQVDIHFTHIGIDNLEEGCKTKYLQLIDFCGKDGQMKLSEEWFLLRRNEQKNITLRVSVPQFQFSSIPKIFSIYFYFKQFYHFKVQLALKIPEQKARYVTNYQAVSSLIFNLLSMVFIILIITLRKRQSEFDKQNQYNFIQGNHRPKTKILSKEHYFELGVKIEKKKRKLQIFIDEEILALKEYQHKKLKDFFNSSCESEIQKKYAGTEQENSNNNILTDLKQPLRNSGILSQQSSLQYIDFNKSIDNAQQPNQKSRENQQSSSSLESDHGDEDSLFEEGSQGYEGRAQADFAWGSESQRTKTTKQENSGSYYNIFLTKNPLKKEEPFHWMQSYQGNEKW